MSLKLHHLVLVLFALIIAGVVSAEPAATVTDPAFPHVALNQNRFAPQVISHAQGCTICRDACTDADIGVIFPCHCTDYQDCGEQEESSCFFGYTCAGSESILTCVESSWLNGCKFIFTGGGACANCSF